MTRAAPLTRTLAPSLLLFVLLGAIRAAALAAPAPEPPRAAIAAQVRIERDSTRAARMAAAGHVDSALVVLTDLTAAARGSGSPPALLRVLRMRGSALANTGAGAAALVPLAEAARLAEGLRDTATLVRVLRWQAYAYGEQGRFAEQRAAAQRQLTLSRSIHDRTNVAHALHSLGWNALSTSHHPEATRLLTESVTIFGALGDLSNESFVRATLGSALLSMGLYDEARANYRRVIEIAQHLHLPWIEARALNDLGVIEAQLGDLAAAARDYDRAYEMHAQGGQWQEAMLDLVNRMAIEVRLGRIDDAVAHGHAGLALCDARGLRLARGWLLSATADAERERGRTHEEGRLLLATLALGDTLSSDMRVDALFSEARRIAAADSMPAALTLVNRALAQDVPRLSVQASANARLAAAELFLRANEPARAREQAQLMLSAPGIEGAIGTQARAWEVIARAETQLGHSADAPEAYRHAAASWEALRHQNADADVREVLGSELGPALATGSALAVLAEGAVHAPDSLAAAYLLAQRLRTRTLLERMTGPAAVANQALRELDPQTLEQVQSHVLHTGEVLIEMYTSPETSLVFVITRERAAWYSLAGSRVLAPSIRLASELLSAPDAGASADTASRAAIGHLARLLLSPAALTLRGARTVLVSPDGVLHAAPFEAMVASLFPAAVAPAVVRVPSATVLAQLRFRAARVRGAGMFAFAGPPADGQALAGAAREVRALGERYMDVTVRDAATDTTHWSVAALARYRILHLAAHTRLDAQQPWRSGLMVGSQVLTAETIARQPLAADLVVLTSCRSAAGRALAGEGVAGLTSAFLSAGSPAVVAALWPVDDQASERFTATFYDALAHGATASGALEAARGRLQADPATSAPFHWAGWVLVGDGDVTVPLRAKSFSIEHLGAYLVALLAFLTAVAAAIGWRVTTKSSSRV